MGIASEMRRLAQDIASCRQDRAKQLGEIKEASNQVAREAQELISNFQANRAGAGVTLRKDLARDKATRKSETEGILKDARDILRGFEVSRRESSVNLRKDLSSGLKTRAGLKASRMKMATQLRQELAQSRSGAQSEVSELLGGARSLITDFHRSHQEEGAKLRKDLARDEADRKSEVARMRREVSKDQSNMQAELKQAAAAWRGVARVTAPPKAPVRRAQETVVIAPEEQASSMEARLLAAVNGHPKGITLSEVANSFGVAPIALGRVSKNLRDKGKIRKQERLYFPVAGKGGRHAE